MASIKEYDDLVNEYYKWCRKNGHPSIPGIFLYRQLAGADRSIAYNYGNSIIEYENCLAEDLKHG